TLWPGQIGPGTTRTTPGLLAQAAVEIAGGAKPRPSNVSVMWAATAGRRRQCAGIARANVPQDHPGRSAEVRVTRRSCPSPARQTPCPPWGGQLSEVGHRIVAEWDLGGLSAPSWLGADDPVLVGGEPGGVGHRARELLREIAQSLEMTIYAGAI